ISVRRSLPLGHDPSSSLQAMQRGVERAVLHLQEFIRSSLNVLPDLVTVSRSIEKRPQDEHVKRSLEEPDPLLRLLRHRRHSTLNLATMVDTRLSIVNGRSRAWILEGRVRFLLLHPGVAESSRKLHAGKPHVQFERRTEASAQARLLRPDNHEAELPRSRATRLVTRSTTRLLGRGHATSSPNTLSSR